jgi:hypothetical protein
METTKAQMTVPTISHSSRHRAGQSDNGWLGGRRGLILAGGVAAAGAALALGQHWLAAADLVPLLFALPCAAMMLMCMRGNHGERASASTASEQNEPSTIFDNRN